MSHEFEVPRKGLKTEDDEEFQNTLEELEDEQLNLSHQNGTLSALKRMERELIGLRTKEEAEQEDYT